MVAVTVGFTEIVFPFTSEPVIVLAEPSVANVYVSPYTFVALFAVKVSVALLMVRPPFTNVMS